MASVKLLTLLDKTSTSPKKIISQMLGLLAHHYRGDNRHVHALFVRNATGSQVDVNLVLILFRIYCNVKKDDISKARISRMYSEHQSRLVNEGSYSHCEYT